MAAISHPKRHASALFHRHHSDRRKARSTSPEEHNRPTVFEGTDTVAQNRKVAVQRIVEVHDALERKREIEKTANAKRPATIPSSAISSDPFTIDGVMDFAEAEVRAFRYFLRKWDPSAPPDPDFDDVVQPSKWRFEEEAVKHFIRRIRFWHESEEVLQAAKDKTRKDAKRDKKEKEDTALGNMWMVEKERQDHGLKDGLKEVSTREGLAQLLWTLLHDPKEPLTPEFFRECTEAVKMKYGIET